MNSKLIFKLLPGLCLILLGTLARVSSNNSWKAYRKYWIYFIVMGMLLLGHKIYKYILM